MNKSEVIDLIFEAMKLGMVNYQIVKFAGMNTFLLDLRNGVCIGDLRKEK